MKLGRARSERKRARSRSIVSNFGFDLLPSLWVNPFLLPGSKANDKVHTDPASKARSGETTPIVEGPEES